MKALTITRFGGPEVLRIIDLPNPVIKAGHVRVAVAACGVNFADIMMRMGLYFGAPPLPFAPGYEISGKVTEVGAGVTTLKVGDRVLAGTKFGGYCTDVVVPAAQVRVIPAKMTDAEAASIPVVWMTAQVALNEMGRVRAEDRVLVHSAAGGVGLAAVQIAARAGAHVTGIIGNPKKADLVREMGAEDVWLASDYEKGLKGTAGRTFHIVLDAAGGPSYKKSYARLAHTGRLVCFGLSSAIGGPRRNWFQVVKSVVTSPLYTPFKLMGDNHGVYGLDMLQYFNDDPEAEPMQIMARALERTLTGFEQGTYRTIVHKTFPLAEGGAAHELLAGRGTMGKVVLTT